MARIVPGCAAMLLGAAVALAAQTERPSVRFLADVSQTAIWRGDQFQYRIVLSHPRDVEIVRDNLTPNNLNVEPFVLVGLETPSRAAGNEQVLELRLNLVLLESTGREAVIPPLTIYYAVRKPGHLGKGTEFETHSLVIPEKAVGVGSTLTRDSKDIRDGLTMFALPPGGRAILLTGWALLGIASLMTAYWAVAYYRRRAEARSKRDRRAVARRALARLDRLDAAFDPQQIRPEQFGELAMTLHEALADITGIPAVTLTPGEIKDELLGMRAPESVAERVRDVLKQCESVRYRRPDSVERDRDLAELIRNSRDTVADLARL